MAVDMKDRIMQIMKDENMDQKDFAAALKISPSSLSNIFNGRSNPTNNHVSAIHRRFPNININWLMFGEGDMYQPTNEDEFSSLPLFSEVHPKEEKDPKSIEKENEGNAVPFNAKEDVVKPAEGAAQIVRETIKYIDKPQRKIIEIRIFFDDGTFEVFSGNK